MHCWGKLIFVYATKLLSRKSITPINFEWQFGSSNNPVLSSVCDPLPCVHMATGYDISPAVMLWHEWRHWVPRCTGRWSVCYHPWGPGDLRWVPDEIHAVAPAAAAQRDSGARAGLHWSTVIERRSQAHLESGHRTLATTLQPDPPHSAAHCHPGGPHITYCPKCPVNDRSRGPGRPVLWTP